MNRRRGEPARRRIDINQAVNPGKQVTVNVVAPSGPGIGRLDEVFYRPVGDHPIERPIPLVWNHAVIEELDVEILLAAAPHLFGRDRDPDPLSVALPDPFQEGPVATTDVQYASALLASDLVQQVVELVSLGLFIRRFGITVINPLSKVEQAAGREEPIKGRVTAGDLSPMLSLRRTLTGRWMGVCVRHNAPA